MEYRGSGKKGRPSGNGVPTIIFYFVLLAVYLVTSVLVTRAARSTEVIRVARGAIPVATFTGVLSSLANICVILLVVFFHRLGFWTALVLLALQLPVLLTQILRFQNYDSIPGLFTGLLTIVAIVLLYRRNVTLEAYRNREVVFLKSRQKASQRLFEQTATALVNAIDAKDTYSRGHSMRVAEYSEKIARMMGKDDETCRRVYYTALLHDVGKIGISNRILNKRGKLTPEEYEVIKMHPVFSGQILESISEYPYLSVGARHHHERYDGKGYPDGLKGEDIPEIARIIAVADAYDAMASNRSYRNAIPQHIVREELVKGMGTQFDPEFGKAMLHMIDVDTEYQMQEAESGAKLQPTTSLRCESIYHDCTEGTAITNRTARISLCSQPDDGYSEENSLPTLIVFDSLDGIVHPGEENNRNLLYFEYARIRLDGQVTEGGTRKVQVSILPEAAGAGPTGFGAPEAERRYRVEAARYKDHAMIKVSDEKRPLQIILALPDASRFVYIAIGGEHCYIHNIRVETDGAEIGPEAIPRIAEEISFIRGCPEGDVPNLQVDGWRTDATAGIPVAGDMTLSFHTMSLPTARLVWHCPFISVFSSDDGRVNGGGFREYMLLRLDGENWESDEHVENTVQVDRRPAFGGWDAWMARHKEGLDCAVTIRREENRITMATENLGIAIHSATVILDDVKDVYVALTGDQCAITDIRVSRNAERGQLRTARNGL